jgi:hypothetical protein
LREVWDEEQNFEGGRQKAESREGCDSQECAARGGAEVDLAVAVRVAGVFAGSPADAGGGGVGGVDLLGDAVVELVGEWRWMMLKCLQCNGQFEEPSAWELLFAFWKAFFCSQKCREAFGAGGLDGRTLPADEPPGYGTRRGGG